ncbi:MAG: hypothetical protein OXF27_07005 [Acidobacteria bacterium]|nr:hypothetical protein [Acidobacteriota bacterium]
MAIRNLFPTIRWRSDRSGIDESTRAIGEMGDEGERVAGRVEAAWTAAFASIAASALQAFDAVDARRVDLEVELLGEDIPGIEGRRDALSHIGLQDFAPEALRVTTALGRQGGFGADETLDVTVAQAIRAGADPNNVLSAVRGAGVQRQGPQAISQFLGLAGAQAGRTGIDLGEFLSEARSQQATLGSLGLDPAQQLEFLGDVYASGTEVGAFQGNLEAASNEFIRQGIAPGPAVAQLFSQIQAQERAAALQTGEAFGVDAQFVDAIRGGGIGFGAELQAQYDVSSLATLATTRQQRFEGQLANDPATAAAVGAVEGLPLVGDLVGGATRSIGGYFAGGNITSPPIIVNINAPVFGTADDVARLIVSTVQDGLNEGQINTARLR